MIEIPLSKKSKKNAGNYIALVSDIDKILSEYNWSILPNNRNVYAKAYIKGSGSKQILMHRLVMARVLNRELFPTEYIDHIDGNGLNNTRENLRIATTAQNAANAKRRTNKKSRYKGVVRRRQKWVAQIGYNGGMIYLGGFDTPEEAHEAYKKKAVELFGEFANFGDKQ